MKDWSDYPAHLLRLRAAHVRPVPGRALEWEELLELVPPDTRPAAEALGEGATKGDY